MYWGWRGCTICHCENGFVHCDYSYDVDDGVDDGAEDTGVGIDDVVDDAENGANDGAGDRARDDIHTHSDRDDDDAADIWTWALSWGQQQW